jgi:hypothetical protein
MLALFLGLSGCSETHKRAQEGRGQASTPATDPDPSGSIRAIAPTDSPSASDEYDPQWDNDEHDRDDGELWNPEHDDEYWRDHRDADPDPDDRKIPDETPDWDNYDELSPSPWDDALESAIFIVVAFSTFSLLCILYGRWQRDRRHRFTTDVDEPLINE